MNRPPKATLRYAVVALLLSACPVAHRGARAEDAADPVVALRTAERASASTEERLEAARTLVRGGACPDAERVLRVATALVGADPATAGTLARIALDAAYPRKESRDRLSLAAEGALAAAGADAVRAQDLRAILLLAGRRDLATGLLDREPPTALAVEVVRRDAPWHAGDGAPTAAAWAAANAAAAALDRATEDDPTVAAAGLDALVTMGESALPLLLATARPGPSPTPPGLVPRRVRAIVALGAIGDARATEVLLPCLDDRQDGWVRLAATEALGTLRDPRAVVPLCRVLFYLGDRHRPHDGWEYPGAGNTDVPEDAWADVAYYTIDEAACDALLRLGVRTGAEWLLEQRLDPRTGRWRIRVLQDAVDAIRRAFPDAPTGYEPDAGYPERQAATDALRAWWRKGPRLQTPLAEDDPVVAASLRELAGRIGGAKVPVIDLQIAKASAAFLGPPMTPAVLAVLATSTRKVQRAELALVLGTLRDRRAVAPLLALTSDPVPAVRANAAEALVAYADPEVPTLLEGTTDVTEDAIVARWLALLDDPEPAPRVAAVKALASVRPRAAVVAALDAHRPEAHRENDFGDWRLADAVARLVHAGTGLDAVLAVLDEPDLFRRRFVWELLRGALRLDPRAFDPTPTPGALGRRPLDRTTVEAALAARRRT